MHLLGVGLGVMVALLWGAGDVLATIAARRLSTFRTTLISQSVSLLILLVFGTIAFWQWHLSFTLAEFTISALIGIFTGLCATLAYVALYRALQIGPITITGPLTATSPIFTLMFSAFILEEHVTLERKGLVMLAIFGIILASSSVAELRILLKKPGFSLWSQGIRWAVIAAFAFGALDFGIGASASVSNWFLPALWTRFFTIFFLTLIAYGRHRQWLPRSRTSVKPSPDEETLKLSIPDVEGVARIRHPFSTTGSGILLACMVGIMESAAVLVFSLDTRIATTGITSGIASSYALVVLIFGLIVYRERPAKNQLIGIAMFMGSVFLLAL